LPDQLFIPCLDVAF